MNPQKDDATVAGNNHSYLNNIVESAAQSVEGPPFQEKYDDPMSPELKLEHKWMFIEQYEPFGGGKQDYSDYEANMQKLGSFNDLITFWQCWNNLEINDMKKFFYDYNTQSVPA